MENGNRMKFMETASTYVKKVKEIDKEEELLEERLRILKEQKTRITQFDLPSLLFEHGQTATELMDGTKISIQPFYYARVDKDKKGAFFEWLRKNGHGGIVKDHFEVFANDPNTIPLLIDFVNYLNKDGMNITYHLDQGIHWKTLEKWFQEVTVNHQAVQTDLFINHVGNIAKIK